MQLCSILQIMKGELSLKYAYDPELHSWLSKCNMEFGCPHKIFFLPSDIQKSLLQHGNSLVICCWLLNSARVKSCSAFDYGNYLGHYVSGTEEYTVLVAHFLYQAHKKKSLMTVKLLISVPISL